MEDILHLKQIMSSSHPSVHELVQEILTKDRDNLARFDAKYNADIPYIYI